MKKGGAHDKNAEPQTEYFGLRVLLYDFLSYFSRKASYNFFNWNAISISNLDEWAEIGWKQIRTGRNTENSNI